MQPDRCREQTIIGLMSPQPAVSDKPNVKSAIESELFISNINKSIESSDSSTYDPCDPSKGPKSCESPQKNNMFNVHSVLEKIPSLVRFIN